LQWRTEECRSSENDIGEVIEDIGNMGKLRSGFVSSKELRGVNIGDEGVKRPTYINANLTEAQRGRILELLREFTDCFAWSYTEMPFLSKELVEYRLPINRGFKQYKHSRPGTST
jgi:hypothetical protein